ncbi:hypothetical protein NEFER03_0826 [Nematocida sp. LUAm3]|nr:hypothetical protein NEFER03_0826 [Nematocida sp. LUAm3]KAI5174844.1 hypothetical protein NEFER02_0944 [Nematocida sp. LUAm2]KAI5177558.1 hypothetical protein NEFER01_0808 [Nematocida sp. LUAm1]
MRETNDEERKDILICGVTGFTGGKLFQYIAEKRKTLRIGVLGRDISKIESILNGMDTSDNWEVDVHVLGVDNIEKMEEVFRKYKVVVNCIGPFIYTGLPIIEAAIRAGTHYVDCTGEPAFIQKSYDMFGEKAKKEGVMVVHACGFDSLPIDIGVVYAIKQVVIQEGESVNEMQAESYLNFKNCRINIGTFKTIVASLDQLKTSKKQKLEKKENTPQEKDKPNGKEEKIKKRKVKRFPFYLKKLQKYAVIFPGSDSYILRKTRETLKNHPICHCYMLVDSVLGLFFLLYFLMLIGIISLLPMKCRSPFYSHIDTLTFGRVRKDGPTADEISSSGFETKIFVKGKKGDNDFKFCAVVSGPDPGYVTTPASLLVCAETILGNLSILQGSEGVHTPGSLLYKTDIVSRLEQENIMFCTALEKKDKISD